MNRQFDINTTRIGDIVEYNARQLPDSTALSYYEFGFQKTFAQFNDICRRVAKGLMALGIDRGDHIAIWANNLPEWIYTQFGSAGAGAVLVTVNTNFRAFELEYLLNQSDATTLLLAHGVRQPDEYLQVLSHVCPEIAKSTPGQLKSEKLPNLKNIIHLGGESIPGMYNWNDLLEQEQGSRKVIYS